jgi:iron complex outermembrane receptor protein
MLKLNVAVPLWGRSLFASGEAQYMSTRRTITGANLPGYGIVNAGLFSRNLVRGLEISADVYNLFDQRYSDPVSADFLQPAIEQNGRTYRLKATLAF